MTLTIDVWQLITAISALIVAIGVGFVSMGKVLLGQIQQNLQRDSETAQQALDAVAKVEREAVQATASVARDLMSLRAELPEKYVRREDYIRNQTVIEAKLDAISSKVELVQIQGARK